MVYGEEDVVKQCFLGARHGPLSISNVSEASSQSDA